MRTLQDANLTKSVAIPAAGATVYTTVLDTAVVNPGRTPCVELRIGTGAALPNLVDGHNVTLTLQDSADGVNFDASSADLPAYSATGAGGTGAAAVAAQVKVPINLGRYLRLQVVADAGAGDSTGVTASFGFVF